MLMHVAHRTFTGSRPTRRRPAGAVVLVALLAALGTAAAMLAQGQTGRGGHGPSDAAVPLQRKPAQRAQRKETVGPVPAGDLLKARALLDDVGVLPSGPGVVVLEPVGTGVDRGLADFGAGCSRWIQMVVGGQGELGKTPTWWAIDEVRQELGLPDLRVRLDVAAQLGRRLGATHVVVADLRGEPGRLELGYEVHLPGSEGRVGSRVSLTGSEADVVRQLPAAASRLARALGVAEPQLPTPAAVSVEGLRVAGRVPWCCRESLGAEDTRALSALADREPLAALMVSTCLWMPDMAVYRAAMRCLQRTAQDNVVILSMLARAGITDARPTRERLEQLAQKHRANYLVLSSLSTLASRTGDPKTGMKLARGAAACTPRNARPWYLVAQAAMGLSDSLRRARTVDAITQEEMTTLSGMYLYATVAAMRATELDRQYATGWRELSTAACFLGVEETADAAFQKALILAPNDTEVLWWGLEIYQPKWLAMPDKLDRVVDAAINASYINAAEGLVVAEHIASIDRKYKPQFEALTKRMAEVAHERLASRPDDHRARFALGRVAEWNDKLPEARTQYLAAARQLGTEATDLWVKVAGFSITQAELAEAADLLKALVAARPDNVELGTAYGTLLQRAGRNPEAQVVLSDVVRRDPRADEARLSLGMVLSAMKRYAEAAEVLRRGVALDPQNPQFHAYLIQTLRYDGRPDEAIQAARAALQANARDNSARAKLADLLAGKGENAAAAAEYRRLVATSEQKHDRAMYRIILGKVLLAAGKRDEAIASWQAELKDEADPAYDALARTHIRNAGATPAEPAGSTSAATPPRVEPSGGSAVAPGPPAGTRSTPSGPVQGAAAQHLASGDALLAQQKRAEALAEFRAAAAADPKLPTAHLRIGQMLLQDGDPAGAEREIRQALAADAKSADAHCSLGHTLMKLNRPAEASAEYRQALQTDPKLVLAHQNLVMALIAAHRLDEAMAAAQAAIRVLASPVYRSLTSMVYAARGDVNAAAGEYKLAAGELRDQPDLCAWAHSHAANIYRSANDLRAARAEWQAVLDAHPSEGLAALAKRALEDLQGSPQ